MSSLDARSAAELSAEASELILRDFLIKAGLNKTLAALNEECLEKARAAPTVEAWYEMSTAVRLPELLLRYASRPPASSASVASASEVELVASRPVVEVLLAHLRTLLGTAQRQAVDPALLPPQPQPQTPGSGAREAPSFATGLTGSYAAEFDQTGSAASVESLAATQRPPATGSPVSLDDFSNSASGHGGYGPTGGRGAAPMVAVVDGAGARLIVGPAGASHIGLDQPLPRAQHERKQRLIQTASSDPPTVELDPKPAAFVRAELHDAPGYTDGSLEPVDGPGNADGPGNGKAAGNAAGKSKASKGRGNNAGAPGSKKTPSSRKKKGSGDGGNDGVGDDGKHAEFYMSMELRARMLRRSLEVLRVNDQHAQRREAAAQQQVCVFQKKLIIMDEF
jgi:hypothetical protein